MSPNLYDLGEFHGTQILPEQIMAINNPNFSTHNSKVWRKQALKKKNIRT